MSGKPVLLMLVSVTLSAAEFRTGQAARAVLGQASFSAHDGGVRAISLVVAGDRLYAADASHRVLTFDLQSLGGVRDDRAESAETGCTVCRSAIAETRQSVMPGTAAVSVWGKTVAVADAAQHQVLIWRDATTPRADRGPDVVLGGETRMGASRMVDPVSVALDGQRLFVADAALHRVLVWNTLPTSAGQPADAVLGQPDFTSTAKAEAAANTVGEPVAMVSNGSELFVADAAAHRVLVFSPADIALAPKNVSNAASLESGPLAAGTLVTIRGDHLSAQSETAAADDSIPLPTKLGGVEAIFDGVALPVLEVSPDEVQVELPYGLEGRTAASLYLRMEQDGAVRITNALNVTVAAASPGLFALGGSEPRVGILLHAAARGGQGAPPITAENPARSGEVVTVWASGLGEVFEDGNAEVPVTAQIDGQATAVVSAKLAEHSAGVYEVRVAVPAGLRGKTARLQIAQSGVASNTVTFALMTGRR